MEIVFVNRAAFAVQTIPSAVLNRLLFLTVDGPAIQAYSIWHPVGCPMYARHYFYTSKSWFGPDI